LGPRPESHLFTGKERDAGTGLDYFGARYLASELGRFTTVDPVYTWKENLVDPQRWNRYVYVRNNPLKYLDPDGRCIWDLCVGEGTALYASVAAVAAAGAWLLSPPGREATRRLAVSTAAVLEQAWRSGRELVAGPSAWGEQAQPLYSKSDPGKGLRDQIAEHERRLRDYTANPDAKDNKGFLKDASPERRQQIIDSRIRELQWQIEDFKRQLRELERRTKSGGGDTK